MTGLAEAVADIERRADATEDREALDGLERDLAILRRTVFEAKVEARHHVEALEATISGLGLTRRLNPFDSQRKAHVRRAGEVRLEHEHLAGLGERLEALAVRFWSTRSEPFLSELVLRAEKIQRGVPGAWATKAAAVAGALYRELDGDAAIDRAKSLLANKLADDPRILLAAFVSDRTVEGAERFLSAAKCKDTVYGAAWMLGRRTEAEASDLVRTLGASPTVLVAALLSDRSKEDIETIRFELDDRADVVVAAAVACGRPIDTVRSNLKARLALEDDVAAFSLFSDRVDVPEDVDRAVRAVIRASPDAERTIRAAALASNLPMARCVALVDGLQQRLTGSWSSEATIIAAALLAPTASRGSDDAPDPWVVHLHTP